MLVLSMNHFFLNEGRLVRVENLADEMTDSVSWSIIRDDVVERVEEGLIPSSDQILKSGLKGYELIWLIDYTLVNVSYDLILNGSPIGYAELIDAINKDDDYLVWNEGEVMNIDIR